MAAGVIAIESHTTVALYASVHFMVEERPEVLVAVSALVVIESPVGMSGHDSHIL